MMNKRIVCVDSDGCVFDSMEIKHKECFAPAFIETFALQPIAEVASDVWARVNLYSRTRGCNRFIALRYAVKELRDAGRLLDNSWYDRIVTALETWLDKEEQPSNTALEAYLTDREEGDISPLQKCLEWSYAVNERIAGHPSVPPFQNAHIALKTMADNADVVVVSQTPAHTLEEEWQKFGLDNLVVKINGQESGSKSAQIRELIEAGAGPEDVLMVGDAPGDAKAAEATGVWFFPITPGIEEQSWERLNSEGLPRFLAGEYNSDYQEELLEQFNQVLQ
ncbi:MAG: HAD family hydrolase [Verrucomicrobiota bacterium]